MKTYLVREIFNIELEVEVEAENEDTIIDEYLKVVNGWSLAKYATEVAAHAGNSDYVIEEIK